MQESVFLRGLASALGGSDIFKECRNPISLQVLRPAKRVGVKHRVPDRGIRASANQVADSFVGTTGDGIVQRSTVRMETFRIQLIWVDTVINEDTAGGRLAIDSSAGQCLLVALACQRRQEGVANRL